MVSEIGEEGLNPVKDFSDWSDMLCLVQWEEEDEYLRIQPGVC